jgi:hypothetical protein
MKKQITFIAILFISVLLSVSAQADTLSVVNVRSWAVERMTKWAPPGKSFYLDSKETESEALVRYNAIVKDAMSVAYDPSEPPLFQNDQIGRAKTLAVLLAVADSESGGYRKDVDFGTGKLSRGDGGKSWCLMQVQLSNPGKDGKTNTRIGLKGDVYEYFYDKTKGFGGEDLVGNRKNCFRVALHIARESFRVCHFLPVAERLSLYASGNCTNGRVASRIRVGKAIKWLAQQAPPNRDSDIMPHFVDQRFALSE